VKIATLLLAVLLLSGCATVTASRDPMFHKGDVVCDVLNPHQPGVITYGYYDPLARHWRYLVRFIPASEAQGWAHDALVWVDSFELQPTS